MTSTKRADRKRRRIANRNGKLKTRNKSVTVEIKLTDGTSQIVKVPFIGEFSITDNDGTTCITQKAGSYQRTIRSALAVAKVGEGRIRNARILDASVVV